MKTPMSLLNVKSLDQACCEEYIDISRQACIVAYNTKDVRLRFNSLLDEIDVIQKRALMVAKYCHPCHEDESKTGILDVVLTFLYGNRKPSPPEKIILADSKGY